jgi:hypothetical protein
MDQETKDILNDLNENLLILAELTVKKEYIENIRNKAKNIRIKLKMPKQVTWKDIDG